MESFTLNTTVATEGLVPSYVGSNPLPSDRLTLNAMLSRSSFIAQNLDPRRNVNRECGWKETKQITLLDYKEMYLRSGIAQRVCNLWPLESWQVLPAVYESDKPDSPTEFDKAWIDLGKSLADNSNYKDKAGENENSHPVWNYLVKLDIISGIGHYGVLLLGFNDGKPLHEPIDGFGDEGEEEGLIGTDLQYDQDPTKPLLDGAYVSSGAGKEPKLTFLRTFPEQLAEVTRWENRKNHPRYGQPVFYNITLNDPDLYTTGVGLSTGTTKVHWSRVVHVADNGDSSSEAVAYPRQLAVWNDLIDLLKVYGASGEGFWQGCFPGIVFETDPKYGSQIELDATTIRAQMQDYMQRLQRYLAIQGMTAKTLSPVVSDPTAHVNARIEAICIKLNVPVRVFRGSERGELASSQDDSAWNDRVKLRQRVYNTPRLVVPLVSRLIKIGVLPEPKEWFCDWPDIDSPSDQEVATVASTIVTALAAYVAGNIEAIMPAEYFLVNVMKLPADEVKKFLAEAEKAAELKAEEDAAMAEEQQAMQMELAQKMGGEANGKQSGIPNTKPGSLPPKSEANPSRNGVNPKPVVGRGGAPAKGPRKPSR